MSRKSLSEEPTSRLAIWSWRLAAFSIPVALLAIVIVRSGILDVMPALATFGEGACLALAAIVLAVAAFAVIWMDGLRYSWAGGAGIADWPVYPGLSGLPGDPSVSLANDQ